MTTRTIAAIATPPGTGGIGIVRISGPKSHWLGQQITGENLPPRQAIVCPFQDKAGNIIDHGIALAFFKPASYTGEDMLELHGHGGQRNLQLLLETTLYFGAQLANPGEFTECAFRNGKMDLLQAEAVADLITSSSDQAVRSAARSLNGAFSTEITALAKTLFELNAWIEGLLDFPEEDITNLVAEKYNNVLKTAISNIKNIIRRSQGGAQLRQGVRMVITGAPNVGKSSLLNRLSGIDAAITSDTPGTTRDIINTDILIEGIPVLVVDTAGLTEASEKIEQEGIHRAKAQIANADVILLVTQYPEKNLKYLDTINQLKSHGAVIFIIYNKADLITKIPPPEYQKNIPAISLSAKSGVGIENLLTLVHRHLMGTTALDDAIFARQRHIDALQRAKTALQKALSKEREGLELIAEDIRMASHALDEITGKTNTEDLLGEIFSRFCIGK